MECQQEIQSALMMMNDGAQGQSQDYIPAEEDLYGTGPNRPRETGPAKPPLIPPAVGIVIFLFIFFSAIGAYIMYVNLELKKLPAKKEKKLSKKKVVIFKFIYEPILVS